VAAGEQADQRIPDDIRLPSDNLFDVSGKLVKLFTEFIEGEFRTHSVYRQSGARRSSANFSTLLNVLSPPIGITDPMDPEPARQQACGVRIQPLGCEQKRCWTGRLV
jgi:hypothetical protein